AKVFTLGLFFCKLLPTSIGGDVFRIAWTSRKGKGAEAFSATFLDRLIGFLSLTFLAVVVALALFGLNVRTRELEVVALGIRFRGLGIVGLLLVLLAGLLALTLVLFNDAGHRLAVRLFGGIKLLGIGRLLDRAYEAVKRFRNEPAALAASFVSGIGVQVALALSWFSVAQALGGRVGLVLYLILIPILNIVVNLPTIGGLGVREWAFVLFFTPSWLPGRLSAEQALATALLFLAIDLGFALLGGVLFAVMRRQGSDVLRKASAAEQKEELGVTGCKTESRGGPAL
ncbi:MAG: lysylphosphatidylglycerol synthase domain-containing protein, partial [candidate division WOR-3 bacterium]